MMTDAGGSQAREESRERSVTGDAYEAPKITVIGPLEKITLGSPGTKADKSAQFKP